MSLEVQTGVVQITGLNSGDTHTIPLSGFSAAPKLVLFYTAGRSATVDTNGRLSHDRTIAAAISATSRFCVTNMAMDAAPTMRTKTIRRADAIFAPLTRDAASVQDGRVDIQSISSTQIVLVNDAALSRAASIGYVVLGGSDITNVALGTFDVPVTTTGARSVTGLGFRPDLVMAFPTHATVLDTVTPDSTFGLGWALDPDGTVVQATLTGGSNDAGSSSDSASYIRGDQWLSGMGAVTNVLGMHGTFTGSTADGFDFDIGLSSGGTAYEVPYIAIKGGSWALGEFTAPAPGSGLPLSGFGFAPSLSLFASLGFSESALGTEGQHDRPIFGAGTGPASRWGVGLIDQDNQSTSIVGNLISFNGVLPIPGGSGSISALLDIASFDSDGLTLETEAGGTSGYYALLLALGPVLSAPTPQELAADGVVTSAGAAALLVGKPLTANGAVTTAGSAALRAAKQLAADGTITSAGSADLAAGSGVALAASGVTTTAGTAALTVAKPLSASGAVTTVGEAVLRVVRALSSDGVVTSVGGGTLYVGKLLAADGSVLSAGEASLDIGGRLGYLTATIRMVPALSGSVRMTPALSGDVTLTPRG